MLDRVLAYVRSVLSGEVQGDPAIGRYLMDNLGVSTEGLDKNGFNANMQVCIKFIPMPSIVDLVCAFRTC
jgi:hypothetical protein